MRRTGLRVSVLMLAITAGAVISPALSDIIFLVDGQKARGR